MANNEMRIITQEERVLLDAHGLERISRAGGSHNTVLLGRVAFFGEAPTVDFIEQETEGIE